MYCNIDDIKAIIPEKELINLTNDTTPAYSVCEDILKDVVNLADCVIDASLRNKYKLPLIFVPLVIRQLSADISAYRLYSRRPHKMPEHIKDNYEYALKTLNQLQKGIIVLDMPSEHPTEKMPTSASVILSNKNSASKKFTDNFFKGVF